MKHLTILRFAIALGLVLAAPVNAESIPLRLLGTGTVTDLVPENAVANVDLRDDPQRKSTILRRQSLPALTFPWSTPRERPRCPAAISGNTQQKIKETHYV